MRAITPMRFGLVLAALGSAAVFGPAPGAMAQESDEAREEVEAELDEQIETRVRLQFLKMELEVRKGQIARLINAIADAEVRQVLDGIDGQPPAASSASTVPGTAATPARPAEEDDDEDDDEDDTQARIDRARETLERMKADYVEKLKEAARLGLKLEEEEMEEIEIEVQADEEDEHARDVRRVVGQIGRVLETLLKAAEEIQRDVDDD